MVPLLTGRPSRRSRKHSLPLFHKLPKSAPQGGPVAGWPAARFLLDGYIAHEHNRQLRPGRFAAGLERLTGLFSQGRGAAFYASRASGREMQVALGSQPLGPKKFTFFSDSRMSTRRLRAHSPSRHVTMSLSRDSMVISRAV